MKRVLDGKLEMSLFERLDWSTFLFQLVRQQIMVLPIFKEIVDIMTKDYPEVFQNISPNVNKKSQAESWLSNFVRFVLREKLDDKLTESRIIELALRHPSAVIEITMRVKDQSELWKKLENTLLILRLFHLGSIYCLWNDHAKISVMWPTGTSSTWSHTGFTELYKYTVDENEMENFKKFFKIIKTLVQNMESEKDAGSLSVAIRRYSNSLLEPVDTERKLMTTMMALESLYSIPSDKGEIGYRMGLRVAKLLSFLGFKPTEVRRNIEKSYYVRSRVAHGLIVDKKKAGNITELLNTLLEYLRVSIIVFLFVGSIQKNRFVASIDNSLIDVTSSIDVKNQIAKIAEQIPSFPFQPN